MASDHAVASGSLTRLPHGTLEFVAGTDHPCPARGCEMDIGQTVVEPVRRATQPVARLGCGRVTLLGDGMEHIIAMGDALDEQAKTSTGGDTGGRLRSASRFAASEHWCSSLPASAANSSQDLRV